ncbi:MAG: SpoIIE family protein phosphatase [Ignavibacterium sp.]|nr:MAG: SpoIIE family protein phosphatase [Ignavibacterium sp.]
MSEAVKTDEYQKVVEENKRLRTAVTELSILNDVATTITSTHSIEHIVDLIVRKCVKHLKVEQGAVMLLDEKNQSNPLKTMIRQQDTLYDMLPYRLDAQLTGWMLKHKTPLLVKDLKNDDRFKSFIDEDSPIKSLLGVPLVLKGKMTGVLTVFNKHTSEGFTDGDQRLLSIIAAQSAQIIENARLYLEEQNLMLMQEEMRLAAETQINLLPKSIPQIGDYQVAGKSIPAKDVGGDYYDFMQIDENNFAFCLGDVSGKGMSAAMLMSNLQATLRAQILSGVNSTETITRANTLLYQNTDSTKFVTLFLGIVNIKSNEIKYCNAGHNNPYHFDESNQLKELDAGGLILGFQPDSSYEEGKIPFQQDDLLVLFSDGITEAMNDKNEEFGEERLTELITKYKSDDAYKMIDRIIDEVNLFTEGVAQSDDITLMIIKRNA